MKHIQLVQHTLFTHTTFHCKQQVQKNNKTAIYIYIYIYRHTHTHTPAVPGGGTGSH